MPPPKKNFLHPEGVHVHPVHLLATPTHSLSPVWFFVVYDEKLDSLQRHTVDQWYAFTGKVNF